MRGKGGVFPSFWTFLGGEGRGSADTIWLLGAGGNGTRCRRVAAKGRRTTRERVSIALNIGGGVPRETV